MKKIGKREASVRDLKSRIMLLEWKKKSFNDYAGEIASRYRKKELSYYEYRNLIDKKIDGKNLHEWVEFIDKHIDNYQQKISEIQSQKPALKAFAIMAVTFIFILCLGLYFKSSMSARVIEELLREKQEGISDYAELPEAEIGVILPEDYSEIKKSAEEDIIIQSEPKPPKPPKYELKNWTPPQSVYDFCGEYKSRFANNTIDGNTKTYWVDKTEHRHYIVYDLGAVYPITGLAYFNYKGKKYLANVTVWISSTANFTAGDIVIENDWNISHKKKGWRMIAIPEKSGRYIRMEFDVWWHKECFDDDKDDEKDEKDCVLEELAPKMFGEFKVKSAAENYPPQVNYVSPIPAQNPIEAGYKNITFYTTVYDANGAPDINGSTITAEFQKPYQTARFGQCDYIDDIDAYSANYSCSIAMWYFDSAGNWNITINAKDLNSESATNSSTYFQYNQLQAISISPGLINFGYVLINSTNKTAVNDPTIISNTGNANLTGKIALNALNLHGNYDSSKFISANVISVDINTSPITKPECAGTILSNSTDITINKLLLGPGNLSEGKAQEPVYYCIKSISNISAQTYSTDYLGSWTIKVLSILPFAVRRKKSRIKNKSRFRENILKDALKIIGKELESKYHLSHTELQAVISEEKTIPVSVFSANLGALEALAKYLKENASMSYHEIAEALKRDDRTIWTSYNNANKKMRGKIKIKNPEMSIPLAIFSKKRFTILESVVFFLRNNGMKYSEIAGYLSRNQKNIRAVCLRAGKKRMLSA